MLLPQHFTKQCSKCNEIKEFNDFNSHIEGKFKLRPDCKKCVAIYKREYSLKNKAKIALYKKQWAIDNSSEIKTRHNEWRKHNKNKVAVYSNRYNQSEKGKACAKNNENRRRCIEKKGSVTNWQLIMLQQNAKNCYWCNTLLKNKKVHIDHYVPVSKGGEHSLDNLVVSCQSCNNKKHAKDPIVFANSLGRLL